VPANDKAECCDSGDFVGNVVHVRLRFSLKGRLLAVHLLSGSDDHDVDRGFVSSETEYFVSDGISGKGRAGARVSNHTSRYTQTHR
jgi:hypothetical protein